MPRPRTPTAKARLTGADRKHPERYRERAEPETTGQPVGGPPAHLCDDAAAVWGELAGALSWLEAADRHALELAAVSLAALRLTVKSGEAPSAALISASRQALAALGATPADRSKVHSPEEGGADDPAARYFDA